MLNDVITKPYNVTVDICKGKNGENHDENFLILLIEMGNGMSTLLLKDLLQVSKALLPRIEIQEI